MYYNKYILTLFFLIGSLFAGTDGTIRGQILDSENTVFKSWLNYLFLNQKEDSVSDYWGCIIIHTNGLKGENERITYKQINTENVEWSSFDLADTDEGNSDIYIQNLSTTQFHYLLKKAEGGGIHSEIHRIK